jgi:hypothetical protein
VFHRYKSKLYIARRCYRLLSRSRRVRVGTLLVVVIVLLLLLIVVVIGGLLLLVVVVIRTLLVVVVVRRLGAGSAGGANGWNVGHGGHVRCRGDVAETDRNIESRRYVSISRVRNGPFYGSLAACLLYFSAHRAQFTWSLA